MKIVLLVATTILINVRANPQGEAVLQFSPVSPNNPEEVNETSSFANESVIEPGQLAENGFVRCLYDFKGNRVNKGCVIPERPPTCEKGSLVQTIAGEELEMCCCNFSNIS